MPEKDSTQDRRISELESTLAGIDEAIRVLNHELMVNLNNAQIMSEVIGRNRDGNLTQRQLRQLESIHRACDKAFSANANLLDAALLARQTSASK